MNQDHGFKALTGLLPTATNLPPQSEPEPDSPLEFGCGYCRDGRFIRRSVSIGHPDFGRVVRCPECTPAPEIALGVPAELTGKTFADFDLRLNKAMGPALARCGAVAEGREWCAFLAGDPGLGKSLLAAGALNASVHPKPGYFWEWGGLLRHIRHQAFDDNGPKYAEEDLLRGWQEGTFLLVLDDVGAEKMTEWANQTLYAILNARYQSRLPTIITTNNPDAIDDRLLSRYYQGAIDCHGADIRRRR